MRHLDVRRRKAASAVPAVGGYAAGLLGHPLPWTKMRPVYRLLGLLKKWGPNGWRRLGPRPSKVKRSTSAWSAAWLSGLRKRPSQPQLFSNNVIGRHQLGPAGGD